MEPKIFYGLSNFKRIFRPKYAFFCPILDKNPLVFQLFLYRTVKTALLYLYSFSGKTRLKLGCVNGFRIQLPNEAVLREKWHDIRSSIKIFWLHRFFSFFRFWDPEMLHISKLWTANLRIFDQYFRPFQRGVFRLLGYSVGYSAPLSGKAENIGQKYAS